MGILPGGGGEGKGNSGGERRDRVAHCDNPGTALMKKGKLKKKKKKKRGGFKKLNLI